MDDPAPTEARKAKTREIEEKKEIYLARIKEEETAKQLIVNRKGREYKFGEPKRSLEEKQAVRRENQNEAWLVNREKEYVTRQFPMAPERNTKYHKVIRKAKIKEDNYLRTKGLK